MGKNDIIHRQLGQQLGFTLLEVLIAIAIMGIAIITLLAAFTAGCIADHVAAYHISD